MNQQGILVVVSGFSGAGKGTLMKELLRRYDNYALSISATTRKPREGEENGREYFFLSEEEFKKLRDEHKLIEYAKYVNHYYGTPKEYVEEKMAQGKDVILEIEIQGAMKIKEKISDTVLVFVTPPTIRELKNRLVGRGTETQAVIESRLRRAAEEAEGIESYDYLLVNDVVENCVDELHEIILSERRRAERNGEFIRTIQKESREFFK